MSQIRKPSNHSFLSLNQKYEKCHIFNFWGFWGPLHRIHGQKNLITDQKSRHDQIDILK